MKIKAKNNEREYILLGISTDQYLIYPDVSGMANWYNKDNYESLKSEPAYLQTDALSPSRKVVEIYKKKYDLNFHTGILQGNESLTPLYFQFKRIELALSNIGMSNFHNLKLRSFNDEFYFSMLVGKFETINEIIDSQLQLKEAHSRFEWWINLDDNNLEEQLSNNEVEKGILKLCEFVSSKIIHDKYDKFLFTDLYGIWKAFLLGGKFTNYGVIQMEDNFEPKFICTFRKGEISYKFDYQFYNW